jgi:hypothetical protein
MLLYLIISIITVYLSSYFTERNIKKKSSIDFRKEHAAVDVWHKGKLYSLILPIHIVPRKVAVNSGMLKYNQYMTVNKMKNRTSSTIKLHTFCEITEECTRILGIPRSAAEVGANELDIHLTDVPVTGVTSYFYKDDQMCTLDDQKVQTNEIPSDNEVYIQDEAEEKDEAGEKDEAEGEGEEEEGEEGENETGAEEKKSEGEDEDEEEKAEGENETGAGEGEKKSEDEGEEVHI